MNQLPLDIPLKNFHQNNGAKILPFAGFNMPINYKTGIINEHKNVRNHSGIFDVSHMGQILIENNESFLHKLEKYIPLQLKKLIKNLTKTSKTKWAIKEEMADMYKQDALDTEVVLMSILSGRYKWASKKLSKMDTLPREHAIIAIAEDVGNKWVLENLGWNAS